MENAIKKFVCLMLAILMLLSVTACKKNNTSSQLSEGVIGYEVISSSTDSKTDSKTDGSTDSNTSQGTNSDHKNNGGTSGGMIIDQSSKGSKVVNNCYVTGYPIAKERVKFKVMMIDDINGDDPNKRALTKFLTQKFNIDFEFEMIQLASMGEKISLAFASGKTPDMFWGMLGSINTINDYVNNGKLYSYDDYKAYAPNIYKFFNEHKDVRYQCTSGDGKIYSLPLYREDTNLYTDYFYINKTWLKKLGLPVPKTLDDLTKVLRAFKNNDPNGNGKKDEVPMMFVDEMPTSWYGFFGLSTYSGYTRTKDNVIKNAYLTDEYKKSLSVLADYYSEGLLYNSEMRNMTAAKAKSIVDASVKTVGVIGGVPYYGAVMSPETYVNHYTLLPIIDATGKGEQVASYMDVEQCWPCWGFVTKTCKYPEIAVRLMDYFYTTEGSAVAEYGPPSKNAFWSYNSKGEPVLNNNGTTSRQMWIGHHVPRYMNESMLRSNFFVNKPKYKTSIEATAEELSAAEQKKIYGNLKPRLTYNLPSTAEEIKKASESVSSNLTSVRYNWTYEFIYGIKSIDGEWSTYVNELTRLGAKVSEEIAQAQDKRMQQWLKKNK